tara:strand:+ start:186656 stop:188044 length:1389 start_codon:yes stop_codon:yes gene_type:complete
MPRQSNLTSDEALSQVHTTVDAGGRDSFGDIFSGFAPDVPVKIELAVAGELKKPPEHDDDSPAPDDGTLTIEDTAPTTNVDDAVEAGATPLTHAGRNGSPDVGYDDLLPLDPAERSNVPIPAAQRVSETASVDALPVNSGRDPLPLQRPGNHATQRADPLLLETAIGLSTATATDRDPSISAQGSAIPAAPAAVTAPIFAAPSLPNPTNGSHHTPALSPIADGMIPVEQALPTPSGTEVKAAFIPSVARRDLAQLQPENTASAPSGVAGFTKSGIAAMPPTPAVRSTAAVSHPAQAIDFQLSASEPEVLQTWDPTTPQPTAQAGAAPRAPLATQIAAQMADILRQMPARPVEITLSPEELGRVRLSVTASDAGIIMNVVAERPETLDLLRRHIDELAQEFNAIGYQNIAFSFAGGERAAPDQDQNRNASKSRTPSVEASHAEAPIHQIHLNAGRLTGLDLRL